MASQPKLTTAMVLAAGMGSRMRHLTEHQPKPLVTLAGRTLIDHVLDGLAAAGIERAVVNVHYCADMIEQHLATRQRPTIVFSDERDIRLETGGGIVRARPLLGDTPFLLHNADSVWIDETGAALNTLIDAFDPTKMDVLMLLAKTTRSLGYDGLGDFHRDGEGRLTRPAKGTSADYVFAGVSIMSPHLFDDLDEHPFSVNRVWDAALSKHRVFGKILDGLWMHVGTPEALAEAEAAMAAKRLPGTAAHRNAAS